MGEDSWSKRLLTRVRSLLVGPYNNRQERYEYYSLPFCAGPKMTRIGPYHHYHELLGEALQATELEFSGLDIDFKRNIESTRYCEIPLNEERRNAFLYAVKNYYCYQMCMDDLPIWAFVGEATDGEYYVWTHKKFEIGYNDDRIVDVNLTSGGKVKLDSSDAHISFSYEVIWKASNVNFEDRYNEYLNPSFFQHRTHWFSIFHSFLIVIFLVGLVTLILLWTRGRKILQRIKQGTARTMS